MRVLAIETTTRFGSIALLTTGGAAKRRDFPPGLTHGRHVMAEVDRLLREADMVPADLSLVAVNRGPGSYTGIRVGVTAAKSIAYGLQIPVVGVEGTRVLAEGVGTHVGWVAPVLDARRKEVYGGLFDRGTPAHREGFSSYVGPPQELADRLPADAHVFGDGVDAYPEIFRAFPRGEPGWNVPDPAVVGRLGLEEFRVRGPDDVTDLVPIYLRLSEAEIRLRERQRRAGQEERES